MAVWFPIGPAPQVSFGTTVSGRVWTVAFSADADGAGNPALFLGIDGGGIWRTTDLASGSPVWLPMTDHLQIATELKPGLQTVFGIEVAKGRSRTIYAATAGGLLWSSDGGLNWRLANSSVRVSKVLADPTDPTGQRLWAPSGTDVLFSTDGGTTWTTRSTGLPSGGNVQDIVYVQRANGVLQLHLGFVDNNPSGANSGFYSSQDLGMSWTPTTAAFLDHAAMGRSVGLDRVGTIQMAADPRPDAPAGVFASVADRKPPNPTKPAFMLDVLRLGPNDTSWRSASGNPTDGGLPAKVYFQDGFDQPIAVTSGGSVILGSSTTGLFRSTELNRWSSITGAANGPRPHVDGHALLAQGETVYYGSDGGINRFDPSVAGAAGDGTWSSLNSPGLQTMLLFGASLHPTKPLVAIVGSQDNSTAVSKGLSWDYVTGGDSGKVRFDPDPASGGKYAYSAGPPDPDPNFFARSDTEGGGPWLNKGFNRPEGVPFFPLFTIHPKQTNRLLFGFARVYETTDRGDNWNPISPLLVPKGVSASAIEYGGDNGTIYVAYGDKFFATTDGGATWTASVLPPGMGGIVGIAAVPGAATTLFAAGGTRLWKSSDSAQTWTELTTNLPRAALSAVRVHRMGSPIATRIFVGTEVGLWSAIDHGRNTAWSRYGSGFPDANVTDMDIALARNLIVAATYGRGAFVNDISGADLPAVEITERLDTCKLGSIAGGIGHFHATPRGGFVPGRLDYAWQVDGATLLSGSNAADASVRVPSAGEYAVTVVVTDSAGNEAAARVVTKGIPAQVAQVLEEVCRISHVVRHNWLFDPLWGPIRERPIDFHKLQEVLTTTEHAIATVRSLMTDFPHVLGEHLQLKRGEK